MKGTMRPFIVYALPRSRTAWLSRFLTYGPWTCGHDVITNIHTVAGLKEYFGTPYRGSAETALVEIHSLMEQWFPDAAVAVVTRPIEEVKQSLAKFSLRTDGILEQQREMLDQVSAKPGVLTLDYRDLNGLTTVQRLWGHCLDVPFDMEHWQRLRGENIQVDMAARLETLKANRAEIIHLRDDLWKLLRVGV